MHTHTHTHTCSPEALGVVSGAVFFIVMFLFILFPFLDNLLHPKGTQYIQVRGCNPIGLCLACYVAGQDGGYCAPSLLSPLLHVLP